MFSRAPSFRSHRYQPALELLEGRETPAVTIGLTPGDPGRLLITGDANSNYVEVYQDDAANELHVVERQGEITVQNLTFTSSTIDRVVANLAGGNDHFSFYCSGDFNHTKTIRVDMGGGNDQPMLAVSGDIHADLAYLVGMGADDNNNGDEYALIYLGLVEDADVSMAVNLGSGSDTLRTDFVGGGLVDANVSLNVLGGANADTILIHAMTGTGFSAEDLDIFAGAHLTLTLDGEDGNDHIDVFYQGMLRGELTLDIYGRQGNDDLYANLSMIGEPMPGPVVSDGVLDANLRGNAGADTLGLVLLNDGLLDFVDGEAPFIDGGNHIDGSTSDTTDNVTQISIELLPPIFDFEL